VKPAHPLQHPAGRTFGLTEEEVAKIRLAAESPLWRYILADLFSRSTRTFIVALCVFNLLAFHLHGNASIWVVCGMFVAAGVVRSTYDWFSKRRLGHQLGYG
jgi:hypothetical protein